jgi:hypothetical protein
MNRLPLGSGGSFIDEDPQGALLSRHVPHGDAMTSVKTLPNASSILREAWLLIARNVSSLVEHPDDETQ